MPGSPAAARCLLVALLLAGCANPPGHEPVDAQPAAADGGSAPDPTRLQLTGCTGWDGWSAPLPRALASWPAPRGWEPKDPTAVEASVFMAGYECQRLSIGPFERGPIRLLYDGHDHVDVPEACLPSDGFTGDVAVLNSVWVDDADVALYLHDVLGLPARPAAIAEQVQDVAGLRLHTWTWGDGEDGGAGANQSSFVAADDGTLEPDLRPTNLFWARGDGIASLRLDYERQGSAVSDRPAHGTMRPPMLLASLPEGAAVGAARWYAAFPASGTLTRYADTLCTQPEA